MQMALDWSAYPGAGGGFQGAVEMCNNNGACRKLAGGTMCPSYRATRDEKDSTRGRANTLRLAISGQLDEAGLASDAVADALKLCVSCKGCKRDCPTGVDMAKMKIEVLAARRRTRGLSLHQLLVAYLPRYAPYAAKLSFLLNLRDRIPGLAQLSEAVAGFTAKRRLPRWTSRTFRPGATAFGPPGGREVVLMVDTFNGTFESENLDAALRVLCAAGYRVLLPQPSDGGRRLCCGRTYLSVGLVAEARAELRRMLEAYGPFVDRGVPVVGIEPSCLFTLRDEMVGLIDDPAARRLSAQAMLLEEFLSREAAAGRLAGLPLKAIGKRLLVHGHCHQKAFGAMGAVESVLRLIPGVDLTVVESSCCGMAGAFGYGRDTYETSMAMAELSLLPAVRATDAAETLVVADGTSCREQIAHGAGREAIHVVQVLAMALDAAA
jgi:Fe-S oxidoreductase